MLLSELSRAAAYEIAKTENVGIESLIFPSPPSLEDLSIKIEELSDKKKRPLNVANKIVALVEQTPDTLGNAVKAAIDNRLSEVKKEVFSPLGLLEDEAVKAQIDHLVEYSWVLVPFNGETTYEQARKRAEAILGARKNTIFFEPVTWGSHREKSSIDGRLESVIPPEQYPRPKDTPQSRAYKIEKLYHTYGAGPHEHLSAVDLLKRLGLKLPNVRSTSHIAALPFLERLRDMSILDQEETQKQREEAQKRWKEYIEQVKKLSPFPIIEKIVYPHPITDNVDGALLFEERLLADTVDRSQFPVAKRALEHFFKFTDTLLNGMRPSPYYVVLLADGDGMGKAIDAQAAEGPDGHRNISKALALFAENVPDIVKKHHGALVYAGGDDVLALLPLHTALDCARKLSEVFKEELKAFADSEGHTPTLSAGMAVMHHVSLLQDALTMVRNAEHNAKNQIGKNALAIRVQKRGGEPVDLVVAFPPTQAQKQQQDQSTPALWPSIKQFELLTKLCEAGIIPGGMAYELRDMMQRLCQPAFTDPNPTSAVLCEDPLENASSERRLVLQTEQHDAEHTTLQKIIQIEAARIVRRKLFFSQQRTTSQSYAELEKLLMSVDVQQYDDPQKMPKIQERVLAFLLSCIGVKQNANRSFDLTNPKEIAPFINALIVAQVFAKTTIPGATKGSTE
jgi:CRISPR-associated protein Cmr2